MTDTGDVQWLSYDELAKLRGITRDAAKRLSFRRKWRRTRGNDNTSRVAVPSTDMAAARPVTGDDTVTTPVSSPMPTPVMTPPMTPVSPGLTPVTTPETVAPIDSRDTETLARERQRADQAEAREAELRIQVERQGRELSAALVRTAIAEADARNLREALEEARAPWVARVLRAWRRSGA